MAGSGIAWGNGPNSMLSTFFGGSGSTNTNSSGTTQGTVASGTNTTGSQYTGGLQNTGGTSSSNLSQNSTTTSTSTTKNSGSTNTSQLKISQAGVNYMVNNLLSGNQGLQSVMEPQHQAGLYNSSVNTQLTNDFVSRIVGNVAAATGVTVQNIGPSSSTTTSGSNTVSNQTGFNANQSTTGTAQYNTSNQAVNQLQTTNMSTNSNSTSGTSTNGLFGHSVICTELYLQKRMSSKHYTYAVKSFARESGKAIRGYYFWAVPARNYLHKNPDSIFSEFLSIVFNSAVETIAARDGYRKAKKTLFGYFCIYSIRAFCVILSYFIPSVPFELNKKSKLQGERNG